MTAKRVKNTRAAVRAPKKAAVSGRLEAWRDQHLYGLFSSIGRLLQRPWATLLTVGVMAVALVLPLCLVMLIDNLERVSGNFRESRDISVFLSMSTTPEAAQALADTLKKESEIENVVLRTPEEGLVEFREMTDFTDALTLLDENPLPFMLVITPVLSVDPMVLVARMQRYSEVEHVQHDAQWRARLSAWLALGTRLTWLAAGLLGIGVLLVVGNTVRLDIQGRAEEIHTVQLLGATDGFIRRPFLYLGAWYGLFAGILALLISAVIPWLLQESVAQLVENYGSQFQLQGLSMVHVAMTMLGAVALGWSGAWLAAGHHLRHRLPQGELL